MLVLLAVYAVLLIAVFVLEIFAGRYEHKDLRVIGYIVGAVAVICGAIPVFSADSGSVVSGSYIVYVNGVKQSSGSLSATERLFIVLMLAAFALGFVPLIGHAVGKQMRKNREENKPMLALPIISVIIGYISAMTGVMLLQQEEPIRPGVIAVVFTFAAVLIALGIRGIVRYKKYKKKF